MQVLKKIKEKSKQSNFSYFLFFSLIIYCLVPFLCEILRTNLYSNKTIDMLETIKLLFSNIEARNSIHLFEVLNKCLQMVFIIPLYPLFTKIKNKENFKNTTFVGFITSIGLYSVFSIGINFYSKFNFLNSQMEVNLINQIFTYISYRTIGFILSTISCFGITIFILLRKEKNILLLALLKTITIVLGDIYIIPKYNLNGIAIANILTNLVIVIVSFFLFKKDDNYGRIDKKILHNLLNSFFIKYSKIGIFILGQVILNNLIYFTFIFKNINTLQIEQQTNFWIANNFFFNFLLIPAIVLGIMLINEKKEEITKEKRENYIELTTTISAFMLFFIPFLYIILNFIMGYENFEKIGNIVFVFLIFNAFTPFTIVFDNLFIIEEKTQYLFLKTLIINLFYYPIVYFILQKNIFALNLGSICFMIGYKLSLNALLSYVFYNYFYKKSNLKVVINSK